MSARAAGVMTSGRCIQGLLGAKNVSKKAGFSSGADCAYGGVDREHGVRQLPSMPTAVPSGHKGGATPCVVAKYWGSSSMGLGAVERRGKLEQQPDMTTLLANAYVLKKNARTWRARDDDRAAAPRPIGAGSETTVLCFALGVARACAT